MKERLFVPEKLTNSLPPPKLERGVIFMANPNTEPSSSVSQRVEKRRPVDKQVNISPERRKELGEAWKADYLRRHGIEDISRLSQEEQGVIKDAIDRGIPPLAGGAQTLSSEGITDTQILDQVTTANTLLAAAEDGDWQDQIDTLQKTLDRLAFLSTADADQRRQMRQMQGRIASRLVELKQVARERPTEERPGLTEEERMYRGDGGRRPLELVPKDPAAAEVKLENYTVEKVQKIAKEVRETIDTPPRERQERRPNMNYLLEKRDQLSGIIRTTDSRELMDQASRLMSAVNAAYEVLEGRENAERVRLQGESVWSSAGEFRMKLSERERLIKLALEADDNPVSEKEIERWFNQRFATADTLQDEDFDRALGTRGQYEIQEFLLALEHVSSRRVAYQNRLVDNTEKEKLDKKRRQLSRDVEVRRYLHNITYYANRGFGIDDMMKVAQQIRTEEADIALRKTGVVAAFHFFEQAMFQVMAKNGGYLPSKAMVSNLDGSPGEVESLVRKHIDEAIKIGAMDKMERWEIDRAVSLGRGMGVLTGRFFDIVIMGGLPKGATLVGWWANTIVNKIAYYHQIARYDMKKKKNKILWYKTEGRSFAWSPNELKEVEEQSLVEVMDRLANDKGDSREIDKRNPFRVSSIFTQTRWRWGAEKVNLATVIARLLADDPTNTLVGVGMWIEKERGNLNSDKKATGTVFGKEYSTEGERAHIIIRKNLELAAKITPLKLFYNLTGLRLHMLRGNDEVGHVNPELVRMYGANCTTEDRESPGQIIIKSELLQNDLSTLAVLQEKLMKKRSDAYKEYLRIKEAGDESAQQPNLLSDEYTSLDYNSLEVGQRERVRTLVERIATEFNTENQKERLMRNLKDQGWKIPFVFGTDDMPLDMFDFVESGDDSFRRRWGDNSDVAHATDILHNKIIMGMGEFRDQDSIAEALREFYNMLSGHDEGVAQESTARLIEGIIKFYKKSWSSRLPVGIGTLEAMLGGRVSYAQVAYGPEQMAWDELEAHAFLRKTATLVSKKQYDDLKKNTGTRNWQIGASIGRIGIPILALALMYYMLEQESKELKLAA